MFHVLFFFEVYILEISLLFERNYDELVNYDIEVLQLKGLLELSKQVINNVIKFTNESS